MSTPVHTSTPDVYLSRENGELVVRQGQNPLLGKHADKRILIVGGGVTGMTVRIVMKPVSMPTHLLLPLERLGILGCWVLCDRRLRPMGITRQ